MATKNKNLISTEDIEEAEKELRKAILKNPIDAEAHYNLGNLLVGQNDAKKLGYGMEELAIALELKGNLSEDKLDYAFKALKALYGFLWGIKDEAGDKGLYPAAKLAELYLNVDDGNNALKWLNEMWNARELLDDYEMAKMNFNFACAYKLTGEFDKGEQKILESKELFQRQKMTDKVELCNERLKELKKSKAKSK
ncbi:MAG: hypothetical protein BWK75_00485 [Candidatus Altiarchaeales archaeon A3]|nr:MAG: hypothetical protein BWK75_00485 [Candidatus Altiarchaeales archaeon A3]